MSLMRLLTVGRSIGAIKDQPSRYKMTEQNLLPKFGPVGEAEAKPASPTPQIVVRKVELLKNRFSTWKKMLKLKTSPGAFKKVAADQQPIAVVDVPKAAFPSGRWSMIRNPFGSRKTEQTPSLARQGELSLDLVKPIRNDLRDADLEVVPARQTVVGEKEKVVASTAKQESTGYLWSRLSSRLFGTEQH